MHLSSEKELSQDNTFAPAVLFIYKRPEHTKKTLEALQNNLYAEDTVLYVYADGARSKDDAGAVEETRSIIRDANGFKEIILIERERNIGLANNIIDGVSTVIQKHGCAIVVEDDIVTSRYFLQYMNAALKRYQYTDEVMAISGYTEAYDRAGLPETFFLPWFECWGWATWERSWKSFSRDADRFVRETTKREIDFININGANKTIWDQMIKNQKGTLRTWAVFFHATICIQNGLVVFCKDNLSINIGQDGSGENCAADRSSDQVIELRDSEVTDFANTPQKNTDAEKRLEHYCRRKGLHYGLVGRGLFYLRENGIKNTLNATGRIFRRKTGI